MSAPTRQEIEGASGVMLDRMAAQIVLGWQWEAWTKAASPGCFRTNRPRPHHVRYANEDNPSGWVPSRSIAHAWELVEHMATPKYGAIFGAWWDDERPHGLPAAEAALAITRAACLVAIGERP